jgi:hypothetical protein
LNQRQTTSAPLTSCPSCGCRDLFIRKDFPQKLGLSLVIMAAGAFVILAAWRATFWIGAVVLVVAALVDAVIYALVGKLTVCYRCRSEFAGPLNPDHDGFELATAEKYRGN